MSLNMTKPWPTGNCSLDTPNDSKWYAEAFYFYGTLNLSMEARSTNVWLLSLFDIEGDIEYTELEIVYTRRICQAESALIFDDDVQTGGSLVWWNSSKPCEVRQSDSNIVHAVTCEAGHVTTDHKPGKLSPSLLPHLTAQRA